jgi:hypothetical protein
MSIIHHTISGRPVCLGMHPRERAKNKRAVVMLHNHVDLGEYAKTKVPLFTGLTLPAGNPPMWHNDYEPDCTFAALYNFLRRVAASTGTPVSLSDDDCLADYRRASGNSPDGMACIDALAFAQNTGIAGGRYKLRASSEIDLTRPDATALQLFALETFGGVYGGYALPITAKQPGLWTVPPGGPNGDAAPGSLGGHCITKRDANPFIRRADNWAMDQEWTSDWDGLYCVEDHALVWNEWLRMGYTPRGLDLTGLLAACDAVK